MYLFLPGNNKSNKKWCESLKNSFLTNKTEMLYYDHWDSEGNINWETELEKINNLNITENVTVIGKSAGCLLGIKALNLGYINVDKFVFMGFPYNWAKNRGDNVDELLKSLKTNSLFIHKPFDPVISYDSLVNVLNTLGVQYSNVRYHVDNEPDDNHDYNDISYLNDLISSF